MWSCIVCGQSADYLLISKETNNQYPICDNCVGMKYYNENIFNVIQSK